MRRWLWRLLLPGCAALMTLMLLAYSRYVGEPPPPKWIESVSNEDVPACNADTIVMGKYPAEPAASPWNPVTTFFKQNRAVWIADTALNYVLAEQYREPPGANQAGAFERVNVWLYESGSFTHRPRLLNVTLPDGTQRLVWQRTYGPNHIVYIDAHTEAPLVVFTGLNLTRTGACNAPVSDIVSGLLYVAMASCGLSTLAAVIIPGSFYWVWKRRKQGISERDEHDSEGQSGREVQQI